ncbi:MAG: ABC transporter permease [Elusimicrobiota bacterium]|nr:ABC transporter permease [Endomicrobiia bacterium]MDW8165297.1 ABC transporter permease [Elusimicrobiota bacterium]
MNFTTYLALKYLKPQKDKFFSYLSLIISVGGISIGVCALIVTLAVMSGFHREIRNRLTSIYPHIIITSKDAIPTEILKNNKNILNFSPFIYSQAILKFNDRVITTVVKGIVYEDEKKIVNIEKIIKWGNIQGTLERNHIVLGKELAKNLNVKYEDEVVMILPTQIITPFGSLPLTEKFVVKGILSSGIFEYDNNLCIIEYHKAKELFFDKTTQQLNGVDGLGIKIRNEHKIEKIVEELRNQFGPFTKVISWIEMNYNLFAALKLEKTMMIIIVSLIIIVACFIIMNNLLLKGIQKSKDIGILMAIGIDKKTIRKIFFLQGMTINLSGIFLGCILGFFLGLLIKQYQFVKLPKEIYYIDKVPIYFSFVDISITLAIAIIVGIIASIYPAYKISQFDPVEIIRYG